MQVEIWTLMAGFPEHQELSDFGRRMHADWRTTTPAATVRQRREEDLRAAAITGLACRHFDFIDCLYRRDGQGQPLYEEAVGVPIHPADAPLPGRLCQTLLAELRDDDSVICQLGIGDHVDHLLVRSAAEMLERSLIHVADVPYVLNHPDELWPRTVSLDSWIEPVSEAGFEAWERAVGAYTSQLSTLFPGLEAMHERLRAYWSGSMGIRLWRPRMTA